MQRQVQGTLASEYPISRTHIVSTTSSGTKISAGNDSHFHTVITDIFRSSFKIPRKTRTPLPALIMSPGHVNCYWTAVFTHWMLNFSVVMGCVPLASWGNKFTRKYVPGEHEMKSASRGDVAIGLPVVYPGGRGVLKNPLVDFIRGIKSAQGGIKSVAILRQSGGIRAPRLLWHCGPAQLLQELQANGFNTGLLNVNGREIRTWKRLAWTTVCALFTRQSSKIINLNRGPFLTLSPLRVINVKIPLQPHKKYDITQYGELDFS